MRDGKPQRVKWQEYLAGKFWFQAPIDAEPPVQCGAYALHTLTGVPISKINKLRKDGHWPDRVMFSFLRKHGCQVIPLNLGNMCWAYNRKRDGWKEELTKRHVILLDQHCFEDESTWSVVYDGLRAHSGEIEEVNPLEFVNFPIQAAYLIFNPKWRRK